MNPTAILDALQDEISKVKVSSGKAGGFSIWEPLKAAFWSSRLLPQLQLF